MEKPFSPENLKVFYTERLSGISSRKELDQALTEGRVDAALKLGDFASPERKAEILAQNPDVIIVAGKERRVSYSYDEWKKSFTAKIVVSAGEVLKLEASPVLPSGRMLTLEVVGKEGETSTQFSGSNLEELKQKSKQLLIKKQWDEWRYTKDAPRDQSLASLDLLSDLPSLPEPVPFGTDPVTGDQIYAYPALTVDSSYYSSRFSIKYFPTREEADAAQAKVLALQEQARAEVRKKSEREELLAPARELLASVESGMGTIGYRYEEYGLTYGENDDLKTKLWRAKSQIESDTKTALALLQEIDPKVATALSYKEARRLAKEKADASAKEHFHTCPICTRELEGGSCLNSEHDTERIDYPADADGYPTGPAVLSQLSTEQRKIVAQLLVSAGTGRGRNARYKGDVYLLLERDFGEEGWKGEPFEELQFEDFHTIMTPEESEQRKRERGQAREKEIKEEVRRRYTEDLEHAKRQVEQGHWKKGKFVKERHPKSNEDQWVLTVGGKGLTVKYVVDRWGSQPTSPDAQYFFNTGKALLETKGFRIILVHLEPPFPEDKPEEDAVSETATTGTAKQEPMTQETPHTQPPPKERASVEALEELKKRFGKR